VICLLNREFDPELFVILACGPARPFVENMVGVLNKRYRTAEQPTIKFDNLQSDTFPGGEPCVNVMESVRKKNVHIFQCFRQTKLPYLCQDFMEFLIVLDAIKRASADEITVYLPYMPFQRQEKKVSGREPISAKLAFDLIAAACGTHYERLVTIDMHSAAGAGFSDCAVDNLTAWPLFASYVKHYLALSPEDIVVVAPDAGGAKRAREFSENLNCHFALIEKKREKGKVIVYYLVGEEEVVGKKAIIIDDMIATGGTLIECSNLLLRKGATQVYAFSTHGLFNPNKKNIAAEHRFYEADIKVVATDTIPEKHGNYYSSCRNWLEGVVSTGGYFADALYCNETASSLSAVMLQYEKNFAKENFLEDLIVTKNKQPITV